jgi:hypothetical protein
VRLDAHLLTCHRALRDSASPTRLSSSISHVRPRPFAAMTPSRHHRRTMLALTWGRSHRRPPGRQPRVHRRTLSDHWWCSTTPLRPSVIATTPHNHSCGLCADCRGCPRTFTEVRPPRTTHRRTLNVVGWRYKRVEHRVRSPSVRSGAAERPKSTVGVDLHMCFAVDHVQDQPVRPDDERGALDRSDEREKAWGDPVRAGH